MTRVTRVGLGTMLLALAFSWTTSFAADVPLKIKWSGTVVETGIDVVVDDFGLSANLIDAQASGSFGASNLSVFSEFVPGEFLCDANGDGLPDEGVLPLVFAFAKPVVTFSTGDQLWGHLTEGSGCLNAITGYFSGEGEGLFDGGTGRFAGATGSFFVTFTGDNITLPDLGVGFGSIRGEVEGSIER